jgi:hypothetical protein
MTTVNFLTKFKHIANSLSSDFWGKYQSSLKSQLNLKFVSYGAWWCKMEGVKILEYPDALRNIGVSHFSPFSKRIRHFQITALINHESFRGTNFIYFANFLGEKLKHIEIIIQ